MSSDNTIYSQDENYIKNEDIKELFASYGIDLNTDAANLWELIFPSGEKLILEPQHIGHNIYSIIPYLDKKENSNV